MEREKVGGVKNYFFILSQFFRDTMVNVSKLKVGHGGGLMVVRVVEYRPRSRGPFQLTCKERADTLVSEVVDHCHSRPSDLSLNPLR